MRSPTTRQQRLKTNRFLLRLRQDTAVGGGVEGAIDRTPKATAKARAGQGSPHYVAKNPYDMPSPSIGDSEDPSAAAPLGHRARVIRSLVEAMAHPLPFLACYSNVCLTLVVAYVCYSLGGSPVSLCCIIVLSPFLGGSVSTIWLIQKAYSHWDDFGASGGFGDSANGAAYSDNVILKNVILAASALFGVLSLVVRWRELVQPYMCNTSSSLMTLTKERLSKRDGDGVDDRDNSYDRGWGAFKGDSESSYPSKNQRADSVEPRLSEISDITLDDAIRTPPTQMFGMGGAGLDRSLMMGGNPSSDYMEMDWHNTLFEHAGARLVYADLMAYLVAVSGLILILEPWREGLYWITANLVSLGGGGLVWVVVRGWEGTTFAVA
jgi:hypothetical protein